MRGEAAFQKIVEENEIFDFAKGKMTHPEYFDEMQTELEEYRGTQNEKLIHWLDEYLEISLCGIDVSHDGCNIRAGCGTMRYVSIPSDLVRRICKILFYLADLSWDHHGCKIIATYQIDAALKLFRKRYGHM